MTDEKVKSVENICCFICAWHSNLFTLSRIRDAPSSVTVYPNWRQKVSNRRSSATAEEPHDVLRQLKYGHFIDWAIERRIYSLRGCHLEKCFVFGKLVEITSHVCFVIMSKHIIDNTRCITTLASAVPEISCLMWDEKYFQQQKWPSGSQHVTGSDVIR